MDKIMGFLKGKGQMRLGSVERILPLDDVIIDNDFNPRQGALDQDVVFDYSAHVDELPPMAVFAIEDTYYLTAGFHRIAAHRLAQRTEGTFLVHQGTMEEAREFADLDNLKHGLRLSRAERRAVVERQLKRHPDWSDTRVALACSTTNKTVRAVREELEATQEIPKLDVLVGGDGITRPRTMSRVEKADPEASQQAAFESTVTLAPEAATEGGPAGRQVFYGHAVSAWRYLAGTPDDCYLCGRGAGSGVYHQGDYHLCFWCYGKHLHAINSSVPIGETLADLRDLAEPEQPEAEERTAAEAGEATPLQPGEDAIHEPGFTDPPLPPVISAPIPDPLDTLRARLTPIGPAAAGNEKFTINVTFPADVARKPLITIYRGYTPLKVIPRDIAERTHAAIEKLTEPEPLEAVEPEEAPEAAPDWLASRTFTVSNGE